MEGEKKVSSGIVMTKELHEKAMKLAKSRELSLSGLIRFLVKREIKNFDHKLAPVNTPGGGTSE